MPPFGVNLLLKKIGFVITENTQIFKSYVRLIN